MKETIEAIKPDKNGTIENKKTGELKERGRQRLRNIFDTEKNGDDRIARILIELGPFLGQLIDDDPDVLERLYEAGKIENPDEFIETLLPVIEPLIRLRVERPEEYEKIARELFVRKSNFTPLNQLLSYGRDENALHIHVAPNESVGLKEKLELLREGLNKLAIVVDEDPAITEVTAASWIVAKHPRILESLGFTIIGEVDGEMKKRQFGGETRPVAEAHISRQVLLDRYLQTAESNL